MFYINIPRTDKKRVVIVGCRFAGLTLAKKLRNTGYQVVILDKHNYHQFPPLFYQVAQVAIQQAQLLADNLGKMKSSKPLKEFKYKDLGTMATVGRHLAVLELPSVCFQGVFAWFIWMFIHLMCIIGVKNKLLIFMNWAFKYFTYDQSTKLILRPKGCSEMSADNYSIPE